MRILIIGAGGREHALAWKLSQSSRVEKIYVAPGNGGTSLETKAVNVDIAGDDYPKLVEFAVTNNVRIFILHLCSNSHPRQVTLVVPGPEQPLVDGVETLFRKGTDTC